MAALAFTVLAHGGHGHDGGGAELAAIAVAAMIVPMILLVVVGRFFLRAAREDEDARAGEGPAPRQDGAPAP